jgi:hypothetical protein
MTESLIIDPRFCGPADSANGGYMCGRVAALVTGQAEVTLRRPPPLATDMTVEPAADGSVQVRHDGALIAEAASVPAIQPIPAIELPDPVTIQDALAAGSLCRLRTHPDEHPFATCFVCGPTRACGDGLRIRPGPVAGRDLVADVWSPDQWLTDGSGEVRSEFVWAALDCPGAFGALNHSGADSPAFVLGKLEVHQLTPVIVGEPYVVVGWRIAIAGRKLAAGSALFTATGQAAAIARAMWIQLAEATAI